MVAKEGGNAPNFRLSGSDGKEHTLNEFKGRKIILYFYPRDDTPGCTIEAKHFNSSKKVINKLHTEIIGVSNDDIKSHEKFAKKHKLRFLLLSDQRSKTIKEYGAYGSRGIFGMGTLRKTFIISERGKILKIFEKVKPITHNKEIIEFLKSLTD